MSYDPALNQSLDRVRRQLGDVQAIELFSDTEIKGYLKKFQDENAAVGHLFYAMAADPVILLELYDRQDGHTPIDRLADLYRSLGQDWLSRSFTP